MARARRKLEVDTFPFLAVLLCAMGSLILLLMVMDRRAKIVSQNKARDEYLAQKAAHDAKVDQARLDALAAAARATEAAEEAAKAEWRKRKAELERKLQTEYDVLDKQRSSLLDELARIDAKLRGQADAAQALSKQVADTGVALRLSQADLDAKRTELEKTRAEQEGHRRAREKLTQELLQLELALRTVAARKAHQEPVFSLVPFKGKHGANRKPIYVELTRDAAIFHPGNERLSRADWSSEVLRRMVEQRAGPLKREEKLSSFDAPEAEGPYLLFLVRPEGIELYYDVVRALRDYRIDFGYELVESDWKFDFGDEGQLDSQPWRNAATIDVAPSQVTRPRPKGLTPQRPGAFDSGGDPTSTADSGTTPDFHGVPRLPGTGGIGPRGNGGVGGVAGLPGIPASIPAGPYTIAPPPGSTSGTPGTPGTPGFASGVPGGGVGANGSGTGLPGSRGGPDYSGSATGAPGVTAQGAPTLGPALGAPGVQGGTGYPGVPGVPGGVAGGSGTGVGLPGTVGGSGLSGTATGIPGGVASGPGTGSSVGPGIPGPARIGSGSPATLGVPGYAGMPSGVPGAATGGIGSNNNGQGTGGVPGYAGATGAGASATPGTPGYLGTPSTGIAGVPTGAVGSNNNGQGTGGVPGYSGTAGAGSPVAPGTPGYSRNPPTGVAGVPTAAVGSSNIGQGTGGVPAYSGATGSPATPGYSVNTPNSVAGTPTSGIGGNFYGQGTGDVPRSAGATSPGGESGVVSGLSPSGSAGSSAGTAGSASGSAGSQGSAGADGATSPGGSMSLNMGQQPGSNGGAPPPEAPGASGSQGTSSGNTGPPGSFSLPRSSSGGANVEGDPDAGSGGLPSVITLPTDRSKVRVSRPPSIGRMLGSRDFIMTIDVVERGAILTPPGRAFDFSQPNAVEDLVAAIRKLVDGRQATVRPGESPYRPMIRFRVPGEGRRNYYLLFPVVSELGYPMSRESPD
jgi:hypothetical protein